MNFWGSMHVTRAKQLILALEQRIDKQKPVEGQLSKLFVPALFGRDIVPVDSLHGRISKLLQKNTLTSVREKQVTTVFASALKALQQNQKAIQGIPLSLLIQLDRCLLQHIDGQQKNKISVDFAEFPERAELQMTVSQVEQKQKLEEINRQKLSLLHSQYYKECDHKNFSQAFATNLDETESFQRIVRYLQRCPEHAHQRIKEQMALITEGMAFQQKLHSEFFPASKPLSPELRKQKLQETAKALEERTRALKEGDAFLFCGSYGKQMSPVQLLSAIFSELPQDVTQGLSPILKESLNEGNLPDVDRLASEALRFALNQIKETLPHGADLLSSNFISSLLQDNSRGLSVRATAALPTAVRTGLESWMKQGLVGNVMEFVSDGSTRDFILWMADKAAKYKRNPHQASAKLVSEIEAKANETIFQPIRNVTKSINHTITQSVESLPKILPGPLFDIMGLDKLFSSGQFWVQFQKQRDGNYTVKVFASGKAIQSHPRDSSTGKMQWPLTYTSVSPERLNSDFLHQLLLHHIEPKSNGDFSPRTEDLYEGLLKHLGGSSEEADKVEWRHVGIENSSAASMMELMLTSAKELAGQALYEMQLEALIGYGKTLLKGKDSILNIDTPEISAALEDAVHVIESKIKTYETAIGKDITKRVEVSLEEIKTATNKFRAIERSKTIEIPVNKINMPQVILDQIHNALRSGGITTERLMSVRSTLTWALGDEVGELIDALMESFGKAQASHAQVPAAPVGPNAPQRGWLRTILFSTCFQVVIKGIQIAILLARFSVLPLISLAMPVVKCVLRRIVPTFIQEWYAALIQTIQQKMSEIVLKLIMRCLLSPEHAASLESYGQSIRGTVRTWATALTNTQRMHYELDEPLRETERTNFFQLNSSSTVYNDFNLSQLENRVFPEDLYGKEQITKNTIEGQLQGWLDLTRKRSKNANNDLFHILISKFRQLEIPERNRLGFWDEVPNPGKCLELLSALSLGLIHFKAMWTHQEYAQLMVSSFGVLAIMDKLARRCPEAHLDGFQTNAYSLLSWLKKGEDSFLEDVVEYEHLKKICNYFMPEVDLNHLPSNEDLMSRAKKTLFDYSISTPHSQKGQRVMSVSKKALETPEFQYLENRYKDPAVQKRMKALGIKLDNNKPERKYTVLLTESHVFSRGIDYIVPVPYNLLRLQALYCKHLCHGYTSYHSTYLYPSHWETTADQVKDMTFAPTYNFEERSIWNLLKEREFSKASDEIVDYISPQATFPNMPSLNNAFKNNFHKEPDQPLNQSEIMAKKLDMPVAELKKLFVNCEPSDRILRVLGYFKEHPEQLGPYYYHSKFFEKIKFLRQNLFSPGLLERQLRDSPQIAQTLAESICKIAEFWSKKDFGAYSIIVTLGIKLQQYCNCYSQQYSKTFYEIRHQIEMILKGTSEEWLKPKYMMLYAMTFPPESYMSQQEQHDAALAYCSAIFLQNAEARSQNNHSDREFDSDFIKQFEIQYGCFLPILRELLKDQEFRNRLIHKVLSAIKVTLPKDKTVNWVQEMDAKGARESEWKFKYDRLTIDMKSGVIVGEMLTPTYYLGKIKGVLADVCGLSTEQLQMKGNGGLCTRDGSINFEAADVFSPYTCTKSFEGKTYEYIPHARLNASKAFEIHNPPRPSEYRIVYWLEVNQNKEKELLIYRGTDLYKRLKVIQKGNGFDLQGKIDKGRNLRCVSGTVLRNQLAPLEHFCGLSDIHCWIEEGQQRLNKIDIPSFQLSFDIESSSEGLRGYSVEHSGYFIVSQQAHPSLKSFPSYLVLENSNGERKVIIPGGAWIASAAWQYVSVLGPIANLVNNHLSRFMQADGKRNSYIYELDAKGQLSSDNPEAMGYLLSLYLLQGNTEAALRACTEFELLCKRQLIAPDILKVLYPLYIPLGIEGISHIRQRIFSALEENRLIQAKAPKYAWQVQREDQWQEDDIKKLQAEEFFTLIAILYDLVMVEPETDPRKKLTPHQEWFLFRRLFHCLKTLVGKSLLSKDQKKWVGKFGFENFIELLFEQVPAISLRYRKVKESLGIKDSLTMRALQSATKVMQAQSSLGDIPFLEPSSTIASSVLPVNDVTKELIATFSNIISHAMDSRSLDFRPLKEGMAKEIKRDPILSLQEMTPEILKRDFLTYYAIARGECLAEQTQKLSQLLPLISGGWDNISRILVRYLEAVSKTPIVFGNAATLESALKIVSYDQYDNFFRQLSDRYQGCNFIGGGFSVAGKFIVDTLVRSQINLLNPVNYVVPYWLRNVAHYGSKAYNAFANEPGQVIETKEIVSQMPSNYAFLEYEDKKIDAELDALFSIAFEELPGTQIQKVDASLVPLQREVKELSEKDGIERVAKSIADFNARNTQRGFLRLRNSEKLWELYLELAALKDKLKTRLAKERFELLKLINNIPPTAENPKKNPIIYHDLQCFFLRGHVKDFSGLTGLPYHAFQIIDLAVSRDTVLQTRLQQVERALKYMEELSKINESKSPHDFEQKVEQLADELKARRAYSFSTVPARLLRRFMLFELFTDKMLWRKQSVGIESLLVGKNGDAVLELLMSLGKTFFGIPTVDSFEANGKKIVFNIWTSGMFGTNMRLISRQSKFVYNQISNALHCTRSRPLTKEHFQAIEVLFKRAKEFEEVINMIKEDPQAWQLLFLDKLFHSAYVRNNENIENSITGISKILITFFTIGLAMGDEAHELFNDKQELNFPVGPPSTVRLNYYQVIEACMRHVIQHPKMKELIKLNDPKRILAIYKSELVPFLADKMSHYWKFKIQTETQRKEFIEYVSGDARQIPVWITQSQEFSEIAMVKGLLTILLKQVFSRKVNVDYGVSTKPGKDYALPYEDNMSSLEQASIKDPYEAVVKTFVMYLHRKLTSKQSSWALSLLRSKMSKEMEVRRVSAKETHAFKLFEESAPGSTLTDLESSTENPKVIEALRINEEIAFFFIRHNVLEQIKYWKRNFRSDAQNFSSMFASQYYDTGTPYNYGMYPDHLKMLLDPGTTGEALYILSKKCPANGIHILNSTCPRDILDEVLKTHFTPGSKFAAVIDGGALLHGLENKTVAIVMLDFVKMYRPDIKAIDFFERDEEGRDHLMSWRVDAAGPEPYDRCNLPAEQRLGYFDRRHGFAANMDKLLFNGVGLNLIGSDHTLYRLLQEIFRLRGIKLFKRLLKNQLTSKELDEINMLQRQSIHFAMTSEVAEMISKGRKPVLKDIVEFSIRNEAELVSEHNYYAYRKKVFDVVRNSMVIKILFAGSPSKMVDLFKKCEHVLVTKNEDDPKLLYGLIDGHIPTPQALEASRNHALEMFDKSGIFSREEREAVVKKLSALRLPPMPSLVHVYQDGNRIHTDLLDNLGREVHQELDLEQELNQEQHRENDLNVQADRSSVSNFKEWGWIGRLDPFSRDWQRFQDPSKLNSSKLLKPVYELGRLIDNLKEEDDETVPPLFRVTDLLKCALGETLQKIANVFDQRIWFSNNFLPRVCRGALESPVDIGSRGQRDLFQVLVHLEEHQKEMKIASVGCLSQHDAAIWRKKLANVNVIDPRRGQTQQNKRVVLYDMVLRAIAAGSAINVSTLHSNPDFLRLEVQIKFLNGSVSYPEDQRKHLRDLIRDCGATRMQEAFYAIHAQRGRELVSGSDIGLIFAEFNNVPPEERF